MPKSKQGSKSKQTVFKKCLVKLVKHSFSDYYTKCLLLIKKETFSKNTKEWVMILTVSPIATRLLARFLTVLITTCLRQQAVIHKCIAISQK